MSTKRCTKCGDTKPFAAFSRSKKGDRNGLHSRCRVCRSQESLAWYTKNREQGKVNRVRWGNENREYVRAEARDYMRGLGADVRRKNNLEWSRKNAAKCSAKTSRRRAAQLQATPGWLTAIHQAQIEEFYEVAQARSVQTGVPHQVDHIEPLQGARSRGLHVPWNLQVLTQADNAAKKNKLMEAA